MKKVIKIKTIIMITLISFVLTIFLNLEYVQASPCGQGQYSVIVGDVSTCTNLSGNNGWATSFKDEFLIKLATAIALSVKSVALINIIYAGFQYMRIVSDVRSMAAIKEKIVNSFLALFIAVSSELIINLISGVV